MDIPRSHPSDSSPWRALGLILLATALVYLPASGFEFLSLDDNINVYDNGFVTDPTFTNILEFWRGGYQRLYIPLTYTLWAFQAKLSILLLGTAPGEIPDPRIFHSVNILLQLLTTGVVFAILRALVKDLFAVAIGTLLFALHPVQVEAVAWVTGFKDLLCGMWSALAIWLYILHAQAREGARRRLYYPLASLCYLCALLSKPSAVTLPLAVGAIAFLLLDRKPKDLARELVPWLLASLPVVFLSQQEQGSTTRHFFHTSVGQRFLVAGDAITFYLGKLLLPLDLAADYGRNPGFVLNQGWRYATGLLPYLLALFVVRWGKKNRWLLAASALFIACLLPVLGFVSFDFQYMSTVADRYLYLAILGPVIGVAAWLARHRTKSAAIIAVAITLLLGIKTIEQLPAWRDSTSFYQQILAVNPRSWVAYSSLGIIMNAEKQIEEATAYFQKAVKANPRSAKAHFNLGTQYRNLNQLEKAVAAYRKAVKLRPKYERACIALGDTYLSLGKKKKAIRPYEKAVLINPGREEIHAQLIRLYLELGEVEEGIEFYRDLLSKHPESDNLDDYLEYLLRVAPKEKAATDA